MHVLENSRYVILLGDLFNAALSFTLLLLCCKMKSYLLLHLGILYPWDSIVSCALALFYYLSFLYHLQCLDVRKTKHLKQFCRKRASL